MTRCLNCGAELRGAFCGLRPAFVPANPTVSELAGDAWQELSGYDGRIAATFRDLLHPGRLTIDYLQGRRARYLSPVRLYLTVSVIYFLIAASAPAGRHAFDLSGPPGGMSINMSDPGVNNGAADGGRSRRAAKQLAERRGSCAACCGRSPRTRLDFVAGCSPSCRASSSPCCRCLPAIVALFYRAARFPISLVFAAHVHAFAFLHLRRCLKRQN